MPLKLAVFLIRQSFLFMPPILPYSWRSSPLHTHTPTKLKRLFTFDNFTVLLFCTTGPSRSSHSKIMCASHRKIVYNVYLSCRFRPLKSDIMSFFHFKMLVSGSFLQFIDWHQGEWHPWCWWVFFLLFMSVMGRQHLPIPGQLGALCQW